MPIFSDSVGNVCVGGTFAPTNNWNEYATNLVSALTTALGSVDRFEVAGNTTISGTTDIPSCYIEWRPNIAAETLSAAVNTAVGTSMTTMSNAGARFKLKNHRNEGAGVLTLLRSGSGAFYISESALNGNAFPFNETYIWLTASARSIALFVYRTNGFHFFINQAALASPRSYVSSSYPLYASQVLLGSYGTPYIGASRPQLAETSSKQAILTSGDANYAIACVNPADTASSTVTDLWLRDNNSGVNNPFVGKVPNIYLSKGSGLTIGSIYKLDENVDGSNLRHVVCCGSFGTDRLLMRVGN